ncbi:MAG: hypothetical protein KDB65_09820 [Calditrichaeota bacterium]|nr:hypothetical protein [Calditrichota bacterium]MCB9369488.1 hypothetical protein [Calditrichota bacterium]
MTRWIGLLSLLFVISCSSGPRTPNLCATWFANAQSIGYLNLQRMALDLRPDSTYRYYYVLPPESFKISGKEVAEGGVFHVQHDTLVFKVRERNGEQVDFLYKRQFRMLPDTTEWPLRVHFARRGVDYEVYFQESE